MCKSGRLAALLASLWLVATPAFAQQAIITLPAPGTTATTNVSTTIAATNTFQQVFAATGQNPENPARRGCTVENKGANNMFVTEGLSVAGSTSAKATLLPANSSYFCAAPGGVVLTGQVNITGTMGDAFYAAQY